MAAIKKSVVSGLFLCAAAAFAGTAAADGYNVDINKTEILHLPGAAAAVVIGNPDIADVSVHSIDTLFLVGRSYGETNLIVLDEFGQTMLNTDIRVGNSVPRNGVQIHNIGENARESYNCSPFCLPSPTLGDSTVFRDRFRSEGVAISNSTVTGPPANPANAPTFMPPPTQTFNMDDMDDMN